ncbi:MAG: MCE family protein [Alphaproteobacteria bacterium]|nr:MAG: MCE family protein [Alphaproteobacteria bacterium]
METKANHFLIGILTLSMSATIALFIMWKTKGAFDQEYDRYDIIFEGSVSGLSEASFVQFNGIKVGTVRRIFWDDEDPNKIRVHVRLRGDTPVKEDTVAQMVFQGVTGVTIVELSGGTPGSPKLEKKKGQEWPVIRSQPSALQEMFEKAPDMISQANLLLLQFHKIASDDNIGAISQSLANIETLTTTLADSDQDIKELLANVSDISAELSETSKRINAITADIQGVTASANRIMEGDAPDMVVQIRDAAEAISKLADNTNSMVEENRDSISNFTNQGLADIDGFIAETRVLVVTLERLAQKLESDPSVLVSGAQYPEYEVPK